MTDERAVPWNDEDTPDQQARCRTLEMIVILRALLDATWREEDAEDCKPSPQQESKNRHRQALRASARAWFLAGGDAQRAHVDGVAACAGLPDGWIWQAVQRYVVDGENPARLHRLYEFMGDRPGTKKFDFAVAFVA